MRRRQHQQPQPQEQLWQYRSASDAHVAAVTAMLAAAPTAAAVGAS